MTEGVYVLARSGRPVYVGTSWNCEVRIRQHSDKDFDSFVIGAVPAPERFNVERSLIDRLTPAYNQPLAAAPAFDHDHDNFPDHETAQEAAEKWGITSRMVRNYAREGRIYGAVLVENWQGRVWLIPKGAKKPEHK